MGVVFPLPNIIPPPHEALGGSVYEGGQQKRSSARLMMQQSKQDAQQVLVYEDYDELEEAQPGVGKKLKPTNRKRNLEEPTTTADQRSNKKSNKKSSNKSSKGEDD